VPGWEFVDWRIAEATSRPHWRECLAPHCERSAQAEIPQDEQDDHDGAYEPDDSVHDSIPLRALKWPEARLEWALHAPSPHVYSVPASSKHLCADAHCSETARDHDVAHAFARVRVAAQPVVRRHMDFAAVLVGKFDSVESAGNRRLKFQLLRGRHPRLLLGV
jgi:hypothetical protein